MEDLEYNGLDSWSNLTLPPHNSPVDSIPSSLAKSPTSVSVSVPQSSLQPIPGPSHTLPTISPASTSAVTPPNSTPSSNRKKVSGRPKKQNTDVPAKKTKKGGVQKAAKKKDCVKKTAKKKDRVKKAATKKNCVQKAANTNDPNNPSKNLPPPGRQWFSIPAEVEKLRLKSFSYTGPSGPNPDEIPADLSSALDFYSLMLTDELLQTVVEETNRYANQCTIRRIVDETMTEKSRLSEWQDVTVPELKVFLGIILWMGLAPRPSIEHFWSTGVLYRSDVGKFMPRNRFELILSHFHLSDNETADTDNRLHKLGNLISYLNDCFTKLYIPGEDVCIDETMVPWRGRLLFRQYIPSKRHKYGIKLYKLCLPHGYTHRLKVYAGKENEPVPCNSTASEKVVMELCKPILRTQRTLYTDNFYTSVRLADKLLAKKTHLVGTLRSNRKMNPSDVVSAELEIGKNKFSNS